MDQSQGRFATTSSIGSLARHFLAEAACDALLSRLKASGTSVLSGIYCWSREEVHEGTDPVASIATGVRNSCKSAPHQCGPSLRV
jgi:hypothetical protein